MGILEISWGYPGVELPCRPLGGSCRDAEHSFTRLMPCRPNAHRGAITFAPTDGPHNRPADSPPGRGADSPQTAPRQPNKSPFAKPPSSHATMRRHTKPGHPPFISPRYPRDSPPGPPQIRAYQAILLIFTRRQNLWFFFWGASMISGARSLDVKTFGFRSFCFFGLLRLPGFSWARASSHLGGCARCYACDCG